jgi:large repetitive protein
MWKGDQTVYTFTGTAGQRLIYDALDRDFDSINAQLISPSGTSVFNINSDSNREPFTLTETGTYRLVIDGSGATVGDYSFRFLDLASAAALTLDTLISGDLTPGLETDLYRFTGTTGQRLYFDSRPGGSGATWYLYGPNNQQIGSASLTGDFEVTLPGDGGYTLALFGDNASGNINYSFQVNSVLDSTASLTLGATIAGNITLPGEQDTYTFTGSVGQRLIYDALDRDFDGINAQLFSPSGVSILNQNSDTNSNPFTLTETGTYRLVIDGSGATTGDYSFRLLNAGAATPLTFGTVISSDLTPGLETDLYRFTGTAGQRLFFDSRSGGSSASWYLYGPNNQNIGSNSLNGDFTVTLPGDGEYLLYLEGNNASGNISYSFQVDNQTDAPVANSGFGTLQTGTLNASAQQTFNFTASAGTRIFFDSQSSANFSVEFRDASNTLIFSGGAAADNGTHLLGRSGNYTLTLRNTGTTAGDYRFQLLDLVANSTALTLGATVSGSLTSSAATLYRFTGSAGQRLYYDALDRDSESITVQLLSGSGVNVFSINSENDQGPLTLTEDGSYSLLVRNNQTATTDFSFRILDTAAVTALALDTLVTSDLTPGLETDLYRFTGTAGQRLFFDSRSGGTNATWTLYSPTNQFIGNNNLAGDFEPTLPGDGTYILVLNGNNATANIPYSFQVVTPEIITTALTLGNSVTGSISEPGEEDVYTFTGTAGQRLLFDSLDNDSDSINVRLVNPTGSTVFNIGHTSDREPFTLTETGTYRLIFDGNGASTGDFVFRLLDIASAPALPLGSLVSDTLTPGLETEIYRFTGSSGQSLFFDSRSGGSGATWYLYGPNNQYINNASLNGDFEVSLTNDGVYVLVLYGNNTSADIPFSFQVNSFSNTTTVLTVGTTVTGEIALPGERDSYTFTATAGQQLYYDALDSDFDGINVQLLGPGGNSLFSQNSDSNRQPFFLSEPGTYRLIFDGSGATTGNYSFRLLDTAAAGTLTLDTTIDGALNPAVETDLYRFTGTAGQRLYFDALSTVDTFNNSWRLYGVNGQSINSATLGNDFEVTLASDGTYLLAIEGGDTSVRTYRFQVVTPDINTNSLNLAASGRGGRKFTYDPVFNRLTSTTDELGHQTLFEIDPTNGNTRSITRVIGDVGGDDDIVTRFTYTSQGQIDTITDALGRITDNDYNTLGRLIKITFAKGTADEGVQQFEYDAAGNQTAIVDENGNRTGFAYDALNGLTRITEADPDGSGPLTSPITTFTYDAGGNLLGTIDPLGRTSRREYDVMNRLVKSIDALNQTATYSYPTFRRLPPYIGEFFCTTLRIVE